MKPSRRTFLGTAAVLAASPALATPSKPVWYVESDESDHQVLQWVRHGVLNPMSGLLYVRLLLLNSRRILDPGDDENGLVFAQMHMQLWSGVWDFPTMERLQQNGIIVTARQHALRIASRLLDLNVELEREAFVKPSTDALLSEAHFALRQS